MRKAIKHLHIFQLLIPLALGCILFMNMIFQTHAAEKSGSCGENLTWILSGDTLTISGSGDMLDYADGALAPWFGTADQIRTINLSPEMTSIGNYAFFGCKNVTNITVPPTVTEIGEWSFAQCKGLLHIDFGTGVRLLGEGAFQECESLREISFPESLTNIGEKAFFRCFSIQTVTVPETVTSVGISAFSSCTNLVRATINATVSELPGWTFYGCTSLADVSLSSGIVSAGEYAFLLCESLNGIYTQGGNVNTVHSLEESIYERDGAPKEGLIKAYEIPETSTVVTDDGKIYTQTRITETAAAVISVKNMTDYSGKQNVTSTVVQAYINDSDGWRKASEAVTKELSGGTIKTAALDLYPHSTTIESEHLELFVGKPVVLQIFANGEKVWKIDMQQMSFKDFTGQYDLNAMAVDVETEEIVMEEVTEDSGITYVPYDAEAVEKDTFAEESHLTDEDGTTYYVTKRSSKWGITGKQFAIYVGLWVASAVLIVAVVMLSMNQVKKSREQYEELVKQGEEEDAAAQEAFQMELLKEMLNKKQ